MTTRGAFQPQPFCDLILTPINNNSKAIIYLSRYCALNADCSFLVLIAYFLAVQVDTMYFRNYSPLFCFPLQD